MNWKNLIGILPIFLYVNSAYSQSSEISLFGGKNYRQYIGCINCSKFSSDSICNKFGDYGSKFSSNSIWNKFGDYGSKFSSFSPWNKFSSDGPKVVDAKGNFYGYLTLNKYKSDKTSIPLLINLLKLADAVDDLDKLCDVFCE